MVRSVNPILEFGVIVARELPKATPWALTELCTLAKRHGNLQVKKCNVPFTEQDKKREENIEAKILAIAKEIGCTKVDFGGDPRGCAVKLVVKSGRTNDFAGDGICVPQ